MAFPLFKFEIKHESFTGVIDITPYTFGWENINFVMERHDEFHSLVEVVEVPLIFRSYAKELINGIIDTYGVDTEVLITVDISYNEGETYETPRPFEGSLQLVDRENIWEGSYIKELNVPIIQNQFWQKFSNRKETPVQIGTTTDLDGETRESVDKFTLNLPDQKVRYSNYIESTEEDGIFDKGVNDQSISQNYGVFYPHLSEDVSMELEGYYTLGDDLIQVGDDIDNAKTYFTDNSLYFHKSEDKGNIYFDIQISYSYRITLRKLFGDTTINSNVSIEFLLKHKKIDDGSITTYVLSGIEFFNITGSGEEIYNGNAEHTEDQLITGVEVGDEFYLYGMLSSVEQEGTSSVTTFFRTRYNENNGSYINYYMDTDRDPSTTDAYMLHDVGYSICNTITGQDTSFYSQYLGNQVTQARQYPFNGEGSYMALMNGIHVRGKTMAEKPFTLSFMDWWNGINPLENLCLFHDVIGDIDTIQVEEKEECYINVPSLTFSNIEDLVETEDSTLYIKSVEIGNKKWKSEEIGALDDPQSKHTYALRFKTFGKDVKILSEFYMASIGIELTRRKDIKETEDWKLDDDIFAIATVREPSSGSPLFNFPELDENFDSISNLLNSDLRYNIRYSPARSLLRWGNWLSQGLIKYEDSVYRFTGGEGNYDMVSNLSSSAHRGSYGGIDLSENQDISWDEPLLGVEKEQTPVQAPIVYEFSRTLTNYEYTVIKNNKRRSIRISNSNTDYINVFIKRLSWNPSKGMCDFTVMKAN